METTSFPPIEGQNIKHSPQHSEHRVIENSTCVESCIYRDAVTLVGRIESKIENHFWAASKEAEHEINEQEFEIF